MHEVAVGTRTGKSDEPIYRIWGQSPKTQTDNFTTLDDFAPGAGIARPDCIKINVDGFDFDVLKAGANTPERFAPWIIVALNHGPATRGASATARSRYPAPRLRLTSLRSPGEHAVPD
ncbi:MAG: FkbM family methyltransferase [Stellaceae bacterium]